MNEEIVLNASNQTFRLIFSRNIATGRGLHAQSTHTWSKFLSKQKSSYVYLFIFFNFCVYLKEFEIIL